MNQEQIFLEAVNKCEGAITLNFLATEIAADKTKTLRKYSNAYGMRQLALHLKKLARNATPPRALMVDLNGTYKKPSTTNTYDPPPIENPLAEDNWPHISIGTVKSALKNKKAVPSPVIGKKYHDAVYFTDNSAGIITNTPGNYNYVYGSGEIQPANPAPIVEEMYEEDDDEGDY